jgi:hypothetical protein
MPRLGGCRDDQMGAAEIYILCFCDPVAVRGQSRISPILERAVK